MNACVQARWVGRSSIPAVSFKDELGHGWTSSGTVRFVDGDSLGRYKGAHLV